MKKIFAIFSAALLLASCNDGFLDKTPLDKLSEDAVFNSDALSEYYVNALYTVLPDPFQEGNVSAITDEGYFRYGGTSTRYILDGRMTPDMVMYINEGGQAHNTRTTTLNIWNSTYEQVRNMNTFLDKMSKANKLSEEMRNRLVGEVYFLRAWSYYNLLQRYGGVPIIKRTFDISETTFDAERATVDSTVAFILSDLDSADFLLPEKADCALGRVNKDAALALRCRVTMLAASPLFNDPQNPDDTYLHGKYDKKKWETAYEAAKAIAESPNYSLASTYEGIWNDINSPEIIWGKFFMANADASTNYAKKAQLLYSVVYFNGWTSLEPTQAMVMDYEMTNGKKWFEEGSGYDPEHPFNNRDPRFYKTVAVPFSYYQNTDGTGYHAECEQGLLLDPNDTIDNPASPYRNIKNFTKWTYTDKTVGQYPDNELQLYLLYENVTKDDFLMSKSTTEPTFTKKAAHMWDATQLMGYELNKWYIPSSPITESEVGSLVYPWFRMGEMYLNMAECAYMLGKESECRDYINKVRSRADVQMPMVTDGGEALWDRLVNERRVELAFEFIRYFDLRRWKTAETFENIPIAALRTMILKNGSKFDTIYRMPRLYDASKNDKNYYWPNTTAYEKYVYGGRSDCERTGEKIDYIFDYKWLGKTYKVDFGDCVLNVSPTPKFFPKVGGVYPNYLMPIPSNEIIKAPTIKQNPGY